MKRFIAVLSLCVALVASASAQTESGYRFTDGKVVKGTPVKNQFRSGTCWCYSGLGFIENEVLHAGGEELDLSEMWIVRNMYFEKAVKYVRLHGHLRMAVGGAFNNVTAGIEKYGIVPQEVYPGLNYGSDKNEFGEIDAVLKAYVDAVILNKNTRLSTAWKDGLNAILDVYFGKMPEKFTYKGKEYTPHSFAESLPVKMSDFVFLTSYTHHPFYEKYIIEVPDNWMWGSTYNVPLDELMQIIDNALANDYSVAWAADVSEKSFSRIKAIGIIPEDNIESMSGTEASRWGQLSATERAKELYSFEKPVQEKKITQEMRQLAFDNYQNTDDHGMVIEGTATDQNGNPFFKVKNSWDIRPPFGGYYYFSRPYVEYKTMEIMVNKNAVPKSILKKLN